MSQLFGGGTYPFELRKWSEWSCKIKDFGVSAVRSESLSQQYFYCHFQTKIASTFVEVSIESSEFRAFDRDLIEGASYFRSRLTVDILMKL